MTYKLIDTREKQTMTKKQEDAIMKAFERFDNHETVIRLPQKEHLDVEFRPGVCCTHKWMKIEPDPEGTKNLQEIFEEKELGDRQTFCSNCKALALWENGEIFAFDAIALQPEKPEKETKPQRRNDRRERR